MKIEVASVASLVLDPANARKHAAKNLEAIKGSLARFGQQKPIVVGKGNVVLAGNGTLEAARSLGWDKIDVVRTGLDGTDATAYAIADNRTGELAEWDAGVLSETLKSLQDMDFDLDAIGFDAKDLAALIAQPEPMEGLTDPDAVPENVETRCKPRDLWVLGNHRLLCGDSTNVQHVERLMGGEKVDLVYTDPPYGVSERTNRGSSGRDALAQNQDFRPVIGDESTTTAVDAWAAAQSLFPKAVHIWWGANYYASALPEVPSWVVWDKRDGVKSDDNADCELAWCSSRKPARLFAHLWKGCIRASEKTERKVHPTQKPVALAEWCFNEHGKSGDAVLDLFLGSGSTLIASEKTGRRCFGMELDPIYCDIIIARWEAFTGKTAVLQPAEGAVASLVTAEKTANGQG